MSASPTSQAAGHLTKQIRKLSPTYKLSQLTLLLVTKTAPVAIGGTIAALFGTMASAHWDRGALRDFRMEVNQEFAKLWAANRKLMDSHLEIRENLQAINDTLKKTQKAQEDCAMLQAARLNLIKKDKKGDKILCSPCVWSNNINSMMKLNRPFTAVMQS
ncbi:hypothetical protein [uncultured Nostoc sp.]|uniref:hypothetical protein n=1 Tax=uncultured Nostoc sp. TaxID=340711 RepID=UPI0035CA11EC